MKKILTAAAISLALGISALAQAFPVLEARDLNGSDPARINVSLGIPNGDARDSAEFAFGELFRARKVELPVRIPKFALGAIETSRLSQALETENINQYKGIDVKFRLAESQSNYDVIRLTINLERGVKRGTYPMVMNVTNPLTKQQGSIAFSVVVRN